MAQRSDRPKVFKDGQKGEKIMKIRRWKTVVPAPILLSLPMMCMHSGDGHHSGSHYSFTHHPSYETSTYGSPFGYIGVKGLTISQDDTGGG